jgi:hypothetical protein
MSAGLRDGTIAATAIMGGTIIVQPAVNTPIQNKTSQASISDDAQFLMTTKFQTETLPDFEMNGS